MAKTLSTDSYLQITQLMQARVVEWGNIIFSGLVEYSVPIIMQIYHLRRLNYYLASFSDGFM